MAQINGNTIFLKIADTVYPCEQSSSMNITDEVSEVTCKSSGGWKIYTSGNKDATLELEYALDPSVATTNVYDDFAVLAAGTAVTYAFGGTTTGDEYFTGSALISSIDYSAAAGETVVISMSLQNTGTPTVATVPV